MTLNKTKIPNVMEQLKFVQFKKHNTLWAGANDIS